MSQLPLSRDGLLRGSLSLRHDQDAHQHSRASENGDHDVPNDKSFDRCWCPFHPLLSLEALLVQPPCARADEGKPRAHSIPVGVRNPPSPARSHDGCAWSFGRFHIRPL